MNKEKLIGGDADNQKDTKYNTKQLLIGMNEEKEHTNDIESTKEIAKDHLEKIPDYYSRLKVMEKIAKKSKQALNKADTKDPKFESCVQQVKAKNPGWKSSGKVNPWAICHASLKKTHIQKVLKKSLGWTVDDLMDMVKEAKLEERMEKSDIEKPQTFVDEKGNKINVLFDDKPMNISTNYPPSEWHKQLPTSDCIHYLKNNSRLLLSYIKENLIDNEMLSRGITNLILHAPNSGGSK